MQKDIMLIDRNIKFWLRVNKISNILGISR